MLGISLLAMKLRGMRRSINISPLRGVLQPLTQSNQRDDFCSKARVSRVLITSVIAEVHPTNRV